MARAAINGMGRIGRAAFKILLDTPGVELVAVNDLISIEQLRYLLTYDTAYGRYDRDVSCDDGALLIDNKKYTVLQEKDPARLPWKDHRIDVVFECTGVFDDSPSLQKHLTAGAQRVVLSAPTKDHAIPMVVHGVNSAASSVRIVSCASCTTNCITPLVEIVSRRIGIQKAMMTTIHAYTATQKVVDSPSKKFRRGRAAACNFVPTTTGAAAATTRVLPELEGRFDGVAVRGPVPVGSLADIVFLTSRATTVEEINGIFAEEAAGERYRGIVGVSEDPLVSSDTIRCSLASLVDLGMTQVVNGDFLKVMSWYDNEWGYASQMVKEGIHMCAQVRT